MTAAALVESLGWTLLHFVWQGCVIALATALALRVLRHADPVHRYNVACLGLLACVLWPAAELYLRLFDSGAAGAQLRIADAFLFGRADGATGGLLAFLQRHLVWVVGFWAACAVVLALRMVLGLFWIGRAARVDSGNAQLQASVSRLALQFGVTRTVRLRVVDNLASPLTAGWLRPLVLVPASLVSGMPHELLEALLAHEMAHVKRLDYLVNLGQNL
ncbi:MAG: M56 family metallopeptidase, partial [Telluria sp.]